MPATLPDHVLRLWRALDERYARVEPTWWGAVVTDARFPAVWDANYARIDVASEALTLPEVEAALVPALRAAGTSVQHVVTFHPEATEPLLAELAARGHRLTWDLVMDLVEEPPDDGLRRVEPITHDPHLSRHVHASLAAFGVEEPEAAAQLTTIEMDVLTPAGKRWFGVRDDDGDLVSIGAVVRIDDVAYVDNVSTLARARGRGLASAVTTRIVRDAVAGGASHVFLLADPDDRAVVGMYERLGFHGIGRLAATRGPVATVAA